MCGCLSWHPRRARVLGALDRVDAGTMATLAALSRATDFSIGCYCEDASRCHRSLLASLLADAGANMAAD